MRAAADQEAAPSPTGELVEKGLQVTGVGRSGTRSPLHLDGDVLSGGAVALKEHKDIRGATEAHPVRAARIAGSSDQLQGDPLLQKGGAQLIRQSRVERCFGCRLADTEVEDVEARCGEQPLAGPPGICRHPVAHEGTDEYLIVVLERAGGHAALLGEPRDIHLPAGLRGRQAKEGGERAHVLDQRLAADLLLEVMIHVRRECSLSGWDALTANTGKTSYLQDTGQALRRKPPVLSGRSHVSRPIGVGTDRL